LRLEPELLNAAIIVIPARYNASRFPGKPLADLNGKPMLQHVWEGAKASKLAKQVIVATDDQRIAQVVRGFGGEVRMTSSSHKNGTERVAEVASGLEADVVVNLQGDLPLFDPKVLDQILAESLLKIGRGEVEMLTAKAVLTDEAEIRSPDTVKVVTDKNGRALYFSRAPIPYAASSGFQKYYKHYGIYCYTKAFLLKIVRAQEGLLERGERLEQLRVLEEGARIEVIELGVEAARSFLEVNTPEDLEKARKVLSSPSP